VIRAGACLPIGTTRGRHPDTRCGRGLAGTSAFTRNKKNGRAAVFVWWRPKWEAGLPGTQRKDGLRCIECTIFRNQTRFRSSDLIREACSAVWTWEHALDVWWPDGLISAVNSEATAGGRHAESPPGHCFIEAGFEPFDHPGKSKRADVWLRYTGPQPEPRIPARSERLASRRPSLLG
jgi:hypothetical protein